MARSALVGGGSADVRRGAVEVEVSGGAREGAPRLALGALGVRFVAESPGLLHYKAKRGAR